MINSVSNVSVMYLWHTLVFPARASPINTTEIKPKTNNTRDVFYVRREVDLMKMAKVNAYIMHIFGKIELLSIHATQNHFKMHYLND